MTEKSRKILKLCIEAAMEKKAEDIVVLRVGEVTDIADYFLICSAGSSRHVQTIADAIEGTLGPRGIRPFGIEGYREAKWILLDYNEVVVHIFYVPMREYYALERLWSDAPMVDLEELMGKEI